MFSSVDTVLWENFGGIRQPIGSSGFESIIFHPSVVAGLSYARTKINAIQGKVSMEWQRSGGMQCSKASEGMLFTLSCGLNGGVISSIEFASYGLPTGGCGAYGYNPSCQATNTSSVVSSQCVGQKSCELVVSNAMFGDPCKNKKKWLSVQAVCSSSSTLTAEVEVPIGSTGLVRLPQLDLGTVSVMDLSLDMPVYSTAKGFNPGVPGITMATYEPSTNVVAVTVNSGKYSLSMSGSTGQTICGSVAENGNMTLSCPSNTRITYISFASFGTSPSTCSSSAFTISSCHAGTSLVSFQRACLQTSSCTVAASNTVFGDPCVNTVKYLIATAICA